MTPLILINIGRFLAKMAVEFAYLKNLIKIENIEVDALSYYARYGSLNEIWPIIYGSLSEKLTDWKLDIAKNIEQRTIYNYSVYKVNDIAVFFFDIGYERWGIIMNNKFPNPKIIDLLKDSETNDLKFIWYSPEQLNN